MGINIILILILVLTVLFLVVKIFPFKNKNQLFLKLSFIIIFIALAIREPTSDMIRYNYFFSEIAHMKFSQIFIYGWEELYLILNYLISRFTSNTQIFMTILAFLCLLGPYFFIKKYSKFYFFSIVFYLLLGFFECNMVVIREALAISILLFSIKYIINKSFFKFLLIIILASLFHRTSLIFIIAYPICNFKLNKFGYLLYLLLTLIIFIFRNFLGSFLFVGKYTMYLDRINGSDGYGKLFLLFIIFLNMLFIHYSYKKGESTKIISKREKNDVESVFWGLFLIGIIFQILATKISICSRIVIYFVISVPIIVSNNIYKIKNSRTKLILCAIILLCCILYAIISFQKGSYILRF